MKHKETVVMMYSFEIEYENPEARDEIIRTLRGDPVLSLVGCSIGVGSYAIRRIKTSGEEVVDRAP